mmetsp:Transcript_6034/g.15796  ORF Transcript_6034/g.15796 Transcript_6034/m.15796 type:complete len:285 (+) Transcript_6034:804-1658(+)
MFAPLLLHFLPLLLLVNLEHEGILIGLQFLFLVQILPLLDHIVLHDELAEQLLGHVADFWRFDGSSIVGERPRPAEHHKQLLQTLPHQRVVLPLLQSKPFFLLVAFRLVHVVVGANASHDFAAQLAGTHLLILGLLRFVMLGAGRRPDVLAQLGLVHAIEAQFNVLQMILKVVVVPFRFGRCWSWTVLAFIRVGMFEAQGFRRSVRVVGIDIDRLRRGPFRRGSSRVPSAAAAFARHASQLTVRLNWPHGPLWPALCGGVEPAFRLISERLVHPVHGGTEAIHD